MQTSRDITYCSGEGCNKKELCVRTDKEGKQIRNVFIQPPYKQINEKYQDCEFYKRRE